MHDQVSCFFRAHPSHSPALAMPTPPEFMHGVGPASVTGPHGRKGTDQAWYVVQDIVDIIVLGKSTLSSHPRYTLLVRGLGGGACYWGSSSYPHTTLRHCTGTLSACFSTFGAVGL
jgi:hypothetical protein